LNAMYIKEKVLSAINLQDGKEMGMGMGIGINTHASYMTMQHFPFFSGISSVGSGRRVVLGFSLGARLIDPGLGEGTRGPCGMVGVRLNCDFSTAGDLSTTGSAFSSEGEACLSGVDSGHWPLSLSLSRSSAIGSSWERRWPPISSVLSSRKSVSYMEPTRPSFSHCSCCMRFACVGMIC